MSRIIHNLFTWAFRTSVPESVVRAANLVLYLSCSYCAYAAAGQLDPTFGAGGKIETSFPNAVIPSRALLQSTGDIIVVAGFDNTTMATEAFGVVRYLPKGTLDTSFGTQGRSLAAFTNFINSPNSAGLQPDGKIVVAGEASSADGTLSEFAVARFNANGGLDSSFGKGGKVTTNFVGVQPGGVRNPATVVLVQTDGKILVVGTASRCAKCVSHVAMARYNTDGTSDTTFGSGGRELIVLFGGTPNAIAELSTGDFLTISGQVIAQFSPAGSLRSSVTGGTIVVSSVGGANVFQADGKYLLAQGAAGGAGENDTDTQLIRFNATGGVDFAFSNSPFDFGPEVPLPDFAAAVAVQVDGRIVVAGTTQPNVSSENMGVARLNVNGSLDATFGNGGRVTTAFPSALTAATAVAIQADGKIVVVGQALVNSTGAVNLVLARYLAQ